VNHLKDVVKALGKKPIGIMIERPNNSITYLCSKLELVSEYIISKWRLQDQR